MALKKIDEFLQVISAGAPLVHVSDRDVPTLLGVLAEHKAKTSDGGNIFLFVHGAGLFQYEVGSEEGYAKITQKYLPGLMSGPEEPITDPNLILQMALGTTRHSPILGYGKNVIIMILETDALNRDPSLVSMMKSLYNGSDKLFKIAMATKTVAPQGRKSGTSHADSTETYKPAPKKPRSCSLVLIGETLEPPPQIASHCFVFGALKMDLPEWVTDNSDKMKTDKGERIYPKKMWASLSGLIQNECTLVARAGIAKAGSLTGKERVDAMCSAASWIRSGIFRSNSVVRELDNAYSMKNVGGYNRVKQFVERRKKLVEKWETAAKKNVRLKGMFLVGVPGSGKTILLEASGSEWGLPSYELNLNLALGKYVGESESRLQQGFDTLKKLAPCFCLIDEVDKVLAGIGEGQVAGSDVPLRIFGMLLKVMNDDDGIIFGVSANRVKALPPEFLRSGRFDRIFFMDVPRPTERAQIFGIHMARRGENPKKFSDDDKKKIVMEMQDFTGADIERVVNEAVQTSIIEEKTLTASMVLDQIKETKLTDMNSAGMKELKTWAKGHATPASDPEEETKEKK